MVSIPVSSLNEPVFDCTFYGKPVSSRLHTWKEVEMIVRIWHGRVPTPKADAYRRFLQLRAVPDYQSVPGNLSAYVLERPEGEITHFLTMTFWENMEAIAGFAGEDVEMARYYPEDQDYL